MDQRRQKKAGLDSEPKSERIRIPHTAGSGDLFLIARRAADGLKKENLASNKTVCDDNLVAIVFSVLAVEGFLNELASLDFRKGDDNSSVIDSDSRLKVLRRVMDLAEDAKLQSLEKIRLAHEVLDVPIDPGMPPFQDYQLLKELRDAIVHPKPSSSIITKGKASDSKLQIKSSKSNLLRALQSRHLLTVDPGRHGKGFINWLDCKDLAPWAIRTASNVVVSTIAALPSGWFRFGVAAIHRAFFLGDEAKFCKMCEFDENA